MTANTRVPSLPGACSFVSRSRVERGSEVAAVADGSWALASEPNRPMPSASVTSAAPGTLKPPGLPPVAAGWAPVTVDARKPRSPTIER